MFTDIPEAIGSKFSNLLKFAGMMIAGLTITFIMAPGFGGLLIVYIPIICIVMILFGGASKG